MFLTVHGGQKKIPGTDLPLEQEIAVAFEQPQGFRPGGRGKLQPVYPGEGKARGKLQQFGRTDRHLAGRAFFRIAAAADYSVAAGPEGEGGNFRAESAADQAAAEFRLVSADIQHPEIKDYYCFFGRFKPVELVQAPEQEAEKFQIAVIFPGVNNIFFII